MNYKMYIGGEWTESFNNEYFEVINPATGEIIGQVAKGGEAETKEAITAAHDAFKDWSSLPASQRSDVLNKWYNLIIENKEEIGKIMTLEQGKPVKEAIGEVLYGASFVQWYAEEAKRVYGETIPAATSDKRILVHKQPVGVIGAITPWNFPAAMITRKIAPALAAGCTAIVKPAFKTPLTAIKLFELLEQAGLPKGVANLVMGSANEIGTALMNDSRVRKITFTGSTEVGKKLIADAAKTVKNVSMELGGHAPLLVFEDADLDKAVEGSIASKFRNCGQVCVATNRIYVQESIKDKFIEKLVAKVKELKVGDGFSEDVDLGPMVNREGYQKVDEQVQSAVAMGAKIETGGTGSHKSDHEDAGYFYEPTVLSNITNNMHIMSDETFGPVVPVATFKTEEEALRFANDTNYGLAAYLFTENLSRGIRVSEGLEYGIVGLNDGRPSIAQAPFGGFKESGIGREGGHFGIKEFLEIKYISIGL
ncbi:succinate semialdehyde dehydrogenase [Desulfonispora thiosulfatigenes DSM 11270]|uniref:Succinate semialdehyde dehydrogenase n=1 Tax=Desulfonispora thiosulfatigenes DSM 11270 TaxID=656914 RepID=A0A1W1V3I2_DESTI|nr:NAD-dependent succinate-semialdehyde dehydrogenase [Desulfonispora thiosulfatigenes]SMB87840.1 succinate semialdehyde dehydrogenase [Desulfonispora thiosulfatigenes DSM 11270]